MSIANRMFFVKLSSILLQFISYVIAQSPQDTCLLTNNGNRLPPFNDRGYPYEGGPGRRIQHRNQAIIPSYKLDCCGNITEWGVDLNPDRTTARFNFTFQVWRPAPNTGCYSLVDDFISTEISIGIAPSQTVNVARITPSLADQLQFQPGDVLGFYVESHGEGDGPGGDENNGVALLNGGGYASELVWYGSISDQTSQIGSCPYQTGTSGILSLSTRAAPVISISITTYSCRQILSTIVVSSSSTLSAASNVHIPSSTTPTMVNVPGSAAYPIALISGVVAALIIVCISTVAVTIVIAVVLAKRRRKIVTLARDQTNSGIVLSNDSKTDAMKSEMKSQPSDCQRNPAYGHFGHTESSSAELLSDSCSENPAYNIDACAQPSAPQEPTYEVIPSDTDRTPQSVIYSQNSAYIHLGVQVEESFRAAADAMSPGDYSQSPAYGIHSNP